MNRNPEMVSVSRTPWREAFPDVVVHSTVKVRDRHRDYEAAKSGDTRAALRLAADLTDNALLPDIAAFAGGGSACLLPVVADELAGFNAIPDALCGVLSQRLQMPVASGQIVQSNKVGHTRAPSFQRIMTPAEFDGHVEPGTSYIIIDDHVGLGGTLANLRGYVEASGGRVVGMTTLTESRDARTIALSPETRDMLWTKHGKGLDNFWRHQFGYGIDCLTELEAQNLVRQPSVAAIENFLAKAAVEARGRGIETARPPLAAVRSRISARAFIIAVDGPAASGKGTIARALAAHYGLPHLDTGLLYRAVGVGVARSGGNPDCEADAVAACTFDPALLADPDLRSEAAGGLASRVSGHPGVRAALLRYQQDFANQPGGAVLDGRDIGTVIAPDADAKLFVTAEAEVRAARRHAEDASHDFDAILADIRARDERDSARSAAPLRCAADADLLDTSDLTIGAAVQRAIALVEARLSR